MIVKKIQINDFGVYGGKNEFDFKTTPEKTVVLCGGTNGAGKTTLFESIMLCFYGKDFDESLRPKEYTEKILRAFHKDSETKTASKIASISIEFEFSLEGKVRQYQITRIWKNNEGRISEELSIKKMIESDQFKELDMSVPEKMNNFVKNRFEEIDSLEKSEWQQFINQLIPKGIAKLFFFDGEKIQSIAEDGNENKHLHSSFDTLLGLDMVQQLQKDIGLMLYRNSKEKNPEQEMHDTNYDKADFESILEIYGNLKIEDITISYLPLLLNLQTDLKSKIENEEEELSEITSKIKEKQKELEETETKFEKIGGKYFSKHKDMEKNEEHITSKIAVTEKEIQDLCSTELPFSLIPEEMKEIKEQIIFDQNVIRSKYELEILKNNKSKISSLISSKEFLPKISDELKKSINSEITSLFKGEIDALQAKEKTNFNLSQNDMSKILNLIENSKKSNIDKIHDLSNSHKIQKNALDKIKLVSHIKPNDDEIRPIMKEIEKIASQKTRLEEEFDQLEQKNYQNNVVLKSINFKIRTCMTKKQENERMASCEIMANSVMTVLEEYSQSLRATKICELEENVLKGIKLLLHKEDFIEKVKIDHESFEVKLFNLNNDEITKNMLSKGELQIYATALVWGLAKTSGRSLPFMIDTPLARLDVEHRENLVESFFPKTSQQTIILSTDSEIDSEYYKKLKPAIAKSYVLDFNDSKRRTEIRSGYFFDKKGDLVVEVR